MELPAPAGSLGPHELHPASAGLWQGERSLASGHVTGARAMLMLASHMCRLTCSLSVREGQGQDLTELLLWSSRPEEVHGKGSVIPRETSGRDILPGDLLPVTGCAMP